MLHISTSTEEEFVRPGIFSTDLQWRSPSSPLPWEDPTHHLSIKIHPSNQVHITLKLLVIAHTKVGCCKTMPTFRELSYIILSSNIDAKSPRQRRLSRTLLRCPRKDIKDTKNPVDDEITSTPKSPKKRRLSRKLLRRLWPMT